MYGSTGAGFSRRGYGGASASGSSIRYGNGAGGRVGDGAKFDPDRRSEHDYSGGRKAKRYRPHLYSSKSPKLYSSKNRK